jgi:hypothetical protein
MTTSLQKSQLKRSNILKKSKVRDHLKIPYEGNCPYMVATDTLNCRKELEGLVDMEEARGKGRCPFWPHKDLETKGEGKNIRSS